MFWLFLAVNEKPFSEQIVPGDRILVNGTLQMLAGEQRLVTSEGLIFSLLNYKPMAVNLGSSTRLEGFYQIFPQTDIRSVHAIRNVIGSDSYFTDSDTRCQDAGSDTSSLCQEFMKRYLDYVREMELGMALKYARMVSEREEKLKNTDSPPEDIIVSVEEPPDLAGIRLSVFVENQRQFYSWYSQYLKYRQDFIDGNSDGFDAKPYYLRISRKNFLLSLHRLDNHEALFFFPISYGFHPDGADKQKPDDGRTPRTPRFNTSPANSPHFIARRINETCKPGMTGACMGIGSRRPEDQFWSQFGMNIAIHGTESYGTVGTRSSNGCIRLFHKDAQILFPLTYEGMPVILD
ncbi:MAG: L,D-transpeptidase [Candidatus Cloacimonetes bacterium]|nr:L,D-transpeptidase [Candidatus Cloacimonadota bacterium]